MGKKCCSNTNAEEDMRHRESQKDTRKKKNKNGKKILMQVNSKLEDNPDTYINNQYDRRGPPMEIRESLYLKKMEG